MQEPEEGNECCYCGGTRNLTAIEVDASKPSHVSHVYLCEDCQTEIAENSAPPQVITDWTPLEVDGEQFEWMSHTGWVLGSGNVFMIGLRRPGEPSFGGRSFPAGVEPNEDRVRETIAIYRRHWNKNT